MALKGSIKEFGLSEIFQLIYHQKQEGILLLEKEETVISICFKKGQIIRAYEGDHDKKLGQNLVRAQMISDDQLVIARYRQDNVKKSLEGVLVDLEFVTKEVLKRLNRLYSEESIYKIFDWESGEYEFVQKDMSYNPLLVQPFDTQYILMESVRQIDEWPALLKKIPSRQSVFEKTELDLGEADEVLEEVAAPRTSHESDDPFGDLSDVGDVEESGEMSLIFQEVDGVQTVQQIIDRAHMGAFETYQVLVELLSEKKIIELKDEGIQQEEIAQKPRFEKEKVKKLMVGTLVSIFVIGLFVLSYPSLQNTSLGVARSIHEVEALSNKNEQYFIRFALDLYYLKYNRYPDSLQGLVEEGLFGDKKGIINHLPHWQYQMEVGDRDKFQLKQIDSL